MVHPCDVTGDTVVRSLTTGEVRAAPVLTAEVGRPLLLGCNITTATGDVVRQVRWHDLQDDVLLAYEQGEPAVISHQEPGVRLTVSHSNSSYITIEKVRPDDEGCYRCVFDVFPVGTQEAVTCVSLTG